MHLFRAKRRCAITKRVGSGTGDAYAVTRALCVELVGPYSLLCAPNRQCEK
jgi:hypothetical protein